jgi:hypothetical protein
VGIGGGVPDEEEGGDDIRLGDVVVSKSTDTFGGVVQHNMGKRTAEGFKRTGTLNKPPVFCDPLFRRCWRGMNGAP